MRAAWWVVSVAAGCSSGAGKPPAPEPPATPAAPVLAVPAGSAPEIDGVVDRAEWAGAAIVALGSGANLRVLHDGAKLYLGVSGLEVPGAMGFSCVFVADPDRVAVHHASAQLGMATYTADATGAFQPASKDYAWKPGEEMLRDEGWTASTVGPDRTQQELALTFARLGLPDAPRPIALGYVFMDANAGDLSAARALTWPAGLDDGVADVQLLAGFNPDGVRFDAARWVRLRIE